MPSKMLNAPKVTSRIAAKPSRPVPRRRDRPKPSSSEISCVASGLTTHLLLASLRGVFPRVHHAGGVPAAHHLRGVMSPPPVQPNATPGSSATEDDAPAGAAEGRRANGGCLTPRTLPRHDA